MFYPIVRCGMVGSKRSRMDSVTVEIVPGNRVESQSACPSTKRHSQSDGEQQQHRPTIIHDGGDRFARTHHAEPVDVAVVVALRHQLLHCPKQQQSKWRSIIQRFLYGLEEIGAKAFLGASLVIGISTRIVGRRRRRRRRR